MKESKGPNGRVLTGIVILERIRSQGGVVDAGGVQIKRERSKGSVITRAWWVASERARAPCGAPIYADIVVRRPSEAWRGAQHEAETGCHYRYARNSVRN